MSEAPVVPGGGRYIPSSAEWLSTAEAMSFAEVSRFVLRRLADSGQVARKTGRTDTRREVNLYLRADLVKAMRRHREAPRDTLGGAGMPSGVVSVDGSSDVVAPHESTAEARAGSGGEVPQQGAHTGPDVDVTDPAGWDSFWESFEYPTEPGSAAAIAAWRSSLNETGDGVDGAAEKDQREGPDADAASRETAPEAADTEAKAPTSEPPRAEQAGPDYPSLMDLPDLPSDGEGVGMPVMDGGASGAPSAATTWSKNEVPRFAGDSPRTPRPGARVSDLANQKDDLAERLADSQRARMREATRQAIVEWTADSARRIIAAGPAFEAPALPYSEPRLSGGSVLHLGALAERRDREATRRSRPFVALLSQRKSAPSGTARESLRHSPHTPLLDARVGREESVLVGLRKHHDQVAPRSVIVGRAGSPPPTRLRLIARALSGVLRPS